MAYIEARGRNKWRIVVSKTINGKRHKVTKTIECTKPKAREMAAQMEADISRGIVSADLSNITVTQFAQKWIDEHVRTNLTPKTADDYIKHLNHRILPSLGGIKISELKPMHVVEFYNLLPHAKRLDNRPGGLSSKSISNIHKVLNSMMNDAVKWQIISDNPVARVEAPKLKKREAEFYDEEDVAKLLVSLDELDDIDHKWKVIVYIALFTGMRSGEIMGLEWKDFDLDNRTVKIQRTSQYISGTGTITKEPKTSSSLRTIAISDTIVAMLKNYKKYQAAQILKANQWNETDRLFTQHDGIAMHPYSPSKWWKKFIEKNGLHPMTFHGLRHTSGTMLFNAGANLESVRKRLGHADSTTFLKIYSHAIKSADQQSADLLEQKLMSHK